MRCPKCGAFMEQGKDVCFMCGINVKTYVPDNNSSNFSQPSNDGMFGSGMGNNNSFNNYNPAMNSNYNRMKEEYQNSKKDYRNVEFSPVKNGERDMFDFFSENKKVIGIVFLVLLVALLTFIGFKYYEHKTKPVEIVPIFLNLYYEVDDTFQAVSGTSNGARTYSKSGEKGNDCSITITYGTSTSGDHVKEYFSKVKKKLEPEKDANGDVVDILDIYTSQENNMTINDTKWYYLNIFYKKDTTSDATLLRYKYLTSMYKGYYYDIELVNNSNDVSCNASLDNFSKSLKFIES